MDEKIPDREAGDFSSVHAPVPAETTDFAGSCRPVFRRSGCPCRFAAGAVDSFATVPVRAGVSEPDPIGSFGPVKFGIDRRFWVFYNYILSKIEGLTSEMEDSSITLLDMITKYNLKYKK